MGIEAPKLDDRSFEDLRNEAITRIPLYTPEWTDHNLSDPGITLIELFAWMMDIVLYRLNRVPDKHFVKLMELLGMRLVEGTPARTELTFWLTAPQTDRFTVPANTEVATLRSEDKPLVVFTTDEPLVVEVPQLSRILTGFVVEDERETFNEYSVENITVGYVQFKMFESNPPRINDALYLGFTQNLSNHILGLHIEFTASAGAGIIPSNPPRVWEVANTDSRSKEKWVEIEVDVDDTQGFNATGFIRLHIPQLRETEINGQTMYWIRCRIDRAEIDNRYTVSPIIRQLQVSSWGGTVSATNVSRVRSEVVGRSDGSPGQRFYLEHTPLVARSDSEFVVIIDELGREERWYEISDFSSSKINDRHYMIDSETGEIRFGPALRQPNGEMRRYGAVPPKGHLVKMTGYRYGGGNTGNVGARALTVLREAIPFIERVTNRKPAIGGMDSETLDHAKMRVPSHLRTLQRAVTAKDFEDLAREAAREEVGRVFCLQPPQVRPGENRVLVVPRPPDFHDGAEYITPGNLRLSPDTRSRIEDYLNERRLLSTRLEVSDPVYKWVQVEVRLRVSNDYEQSRVLEAVRKRLFTFLNPLTGGMNGTGWEFGRVLLESDISAALSTVPGINFIRSIKLFMFDYKDEGFINRSEQKEIELAPYEVVASYQEHLVISEL